MRERERETESPRENIHTYPAFPVRKIAHKVVNRADADTEQGIHDHERHCRLQRSSSKRHPVSLPAHFPKYISPAHLRHTQTHTHTHKSQRNRKISTGEHNPQLSNFLVSTRMLRRKSSGEQTHSRARTNKRPKDLKGTKK